MEIEEACRIMDLLTNGINPDTGSPLPKKSPYNSPRIMRALYFALERMKAHSPGSTMTAAVPQDVPTVTPTPEPVAEKPTEKAPDPRYLNQGKPWTDEEDHQLRDEFTAQQLSVGAIAKRHLRSWSGIAFRLVALELANSVDDLKVPPAVTDEQ